MRILTRAAVLVALGTVAVMPRARAQSVVVGPLPSTMSAIPGASIIVPVVADLTSSGGASLGSVAARLTWRPGTLAFVSTSVGALGSPTVNADSASSGILKFAVANASGATGMPVLINATFNVTGAPAETTTLGLSVTEITAAGSFADLKPITIATGARFCTTAGVWGDLDGDGLFTGHDALIILTYAVGLPVAPYSVVNGDVDGSGVVDSRDALIVLSAAVGIPVTQFRIGQINTGVCALRSAASVQIQPRTPSVAPGDSLPVTAIVRDSAYALVQGVGLVWASKDVTIVRAGANGSLVAVAPGSTYATVFVQPGVKDSVPVVVTSVRHVWYVNPAVAAGNLGVEFGSQLYPFSTIDTALVRAAASDTVRVAPADYGPAHVTKPLVMLGDSTAGGFPRLMSLTTPALRVDSVAGAVTIRGFRLLNSFKGLVATYVQTLELGSISVEGSRNLGIRVHAVDSLLLAHSGVVGAVGLGIALDSVRTIVLDHVRSDAIARAPSDTIAPLALRIAQDTTLSGDSLTLGTAGLWIDSTVTVGLRRVRVSGSQGPALQVSATTISIAGGDFSGAVMPGGGAPASWEPSSYTIALMAGASVRFDTSKVHDNGLYGIYLFGGAGDSLRADTVARNYPAPAYESACVFTGFGWLTIANTAFLNNGPGYVDIESSGADSVTADSAVFDGTDAYVYGVAAFRMHGGRVRNGLAPALGVDNVAAVELDSIEASANAWNGDNYAGFAMPAVAVYSATTATVNGISAHDNQGGALGTFNTGMLRINGGTMQNNGFGSFLYSSYTRAALVADGVTDARIHGVSIRDTSDAAIYFMAATSSQTVIDSSVLQGSRQLVEGWGPDSTAHLNLYGNQFGNWTIMGVDVTSASVVADSNQFAGCVSGNAALYVYAGPTQVARNAMTGCGAFAWVQGLYQASGPAVEVRGNVVTRDTTTTVPAIWLQLGLGYVQVVGNTISGGGGNGIVVDGSGYAADSVRVDSNSVRQTAGSGIEVMNVGSPPVRLRYNLVADNLGHGLLMYTPFAAMANTVVRNDTGVADFSSGPSSFRLGNIAGNAPPGLVTSTPAMTADSNWWGSASGAKCPFVSIGCDTTVAATGDVVADSVLTVATALAAASGSAPAIPPPAAPIARPLAVRSVAVPPAPKAAQDVRRPGTTPRAAQAAPRSMVPRVIRPNGRPTGHHVPVWKTGGQQ